MQDFIAPKGVNFCSDHELLPEILSAALIKTVYFLKDLEPQGTILYRYDDWWEHDGLHFPNGKTDFPELFQIVQSPSSLLKAMPGDFCVFIGVSPPDFRWYLRFYLDPDADDEELFGRFDLTLPRELAEHYKERADQPSGMRMHEQGADEYYRSIYQ